MMKWINDMQDGDQINGQLLVASVAKCESDRAKPYLNITFQDKTGIIEAKKWEIVEGDLETSVVGNIMNVDGVVLKYRDKPQLKVLNVNQVNPNEINILNFQKECLVPKEELIKKLDKYLASFKDKDVSLIVNTLIKHYYKDYIAYPGGIRVHHDFDGGLMYHSLAMADLAEEVCKLYPQVDRDILVGGALIHDIGKTIEYSNPVIPTMTLEGKLIGHISLMYAEFKKIVDDLHIESEVPLLLEHMILSHHGTREFGCPVVPSTREAVLLSMIDLLDSKMQIMDKALDPTKEGDFTQKIWPMDNIALYKPKAR